MDVTTNLLCQRKLWNLVKIYSKSFVWEGIIEIIYHDLCMNIKTDDELDTELMLGLRFSGLFSKFKLIWHVSLKLSYQHLYFEKVIWLCVYV